MSLTHRLDAIIESCQLGESSVDGTRPAFGLQLAFLLPPTIMYLLYVDESGDPSPNGSRFLLLGAAALFEGKWASLDSDLRLSLDSSFPAGTSRPSEIHLAPLRRSKDKYRSLSADQRGCSG